MNKVAKIHFFGIGSAPPVRFYGYNAFNQLFIVTYTKNKNAAEKIVLLPPKGNLMESSDKEKLWNKEYIKVMATNFSLFFAFYILTPLLPIYLSEHFGATKDVIGLVLSGYAVAALLFRPFSGYIVDSFNRKKVLICFMLLSFVFYGCYILAGTLVLFAVVRTLHGGPFGACTVANSKQQHRHRHRAHRRHRPLQSFRKLQHTLPRSFAVRSIERGTLRNGEAAATRSRGRQEEDFP